MFAGVVDVLLADYAFAVLLKDGYAAMEGTEHRTGDDDSGPMSIRSGWMLAVGDEKESRRHEKISSRLRRRWEKLHTCRSPGENTTSIAF